MTLIIQIHLCFYLTYKGEKTRASKIKINFHSVVFPICSNCMIKTFYITLLLKSVILVIFVRMSGIT